MQDPAVLRVRAKVNLILDDDELQRALPRREAIVEITLNDGTKLSEHVTAVRGTPSNPMTREEVVSEGARADGARPWRSKRGKPHRQNARPRKREEHS